MTTELDSTTHGLQTAADYLDVFGPCLGDISVQEQHIKRVHRRLAKILHPDHYHDPTDNQTARTGFERLEAFRSQALRAAREGTYGQTVVLATITTRKARHTILRPLAGGDLGDLYVSLSGSGTAEQPTVCKVARRATDNDLLQAEVAALRAMQPTDPDDLGQGFIPVLVDAFVYPEKRKANRQVIVLERLEGFYTLEQIRRAFPDGLSPLHTAWIWRRLLVCLGYAHDKGVVHGAVLPPHVMIHPEEHGLVVVDWCYASIAQDTAVYPPIKAVVDRYKDWYPKEVTNKQAPSPATDLLMAARSMIELMGGDPLTGNLPATVNRPFRAFFNGCLLERQSYRPQNAWVLLKEFDELLERLGPPYHPRRFRPFTMPTGTVN